jgi:DNA-binding GntR family transcriptional regulator/predicted metal-dependent enzyme (double-stranded beta helix superfamily)
MPAVPVKLVKMSHPEPTTVQPSLNRIAFERIKRDIITCALEPGREVTEAQLAARYALGKTPIRAALLGLSQEGFLRAIPRRGYLITPITMRDGQDIIQLRLLLEPTAARLAAGRVGDDHLNRLEDLCRVRVKPGEGSSEVAVNAHRELHLIIASTSGNQRLADALSKLYDHVERLIYLGVSRINPEEMAGYLPLVAALAAGDGEMASRLMVEQIELGRKRILEALLSKASQEEVDIREGLQRSSADLAEFANQVSAILSGDTPGEFAFRVAEKLPKLLRNPKLLSAGQRESSLQSYRRHLLYADTEGRFSIQALVWEAGQSTPAHDHTCWSVVGVYEGELRESSYRRLESAGGASRLLPMGVTHYRKGDVTYLDLAGSELHRLDNPTNGVTISIHVYGSGARGSGSTIGQCYLPEDIAAPVREN